jgi:hypothetical protein
MSRSIVTFVAAACAISCTSKGPAGPQGPEGPPGTDYDVAVADGGTLTLDGGVVVVEGPAGAQGPQGAEGPQGRAGPEGPPGTATYVVTLADGGTLRVDGGVIVVEGPGGATGPAGPTGSPGPSGPAGPTGPAGPVGPTGTPGGQVWSASMKLPASLTNIGVLGPASGVALGQTLTAGTVLAMALPVPQSCIASSFSAAVVGARNTSSATIAVGTATLAGLALGEVSSSALECQVAADNGAAVQCASGLSFSLTPATFIAIIVYNFSNAPDYEGATVLTSFTCQ